MRAIGLCELREEVFAPLGVDWSDLKFTDTGGEVRVSGYQANGSYSRATTLPNGRTLEVRGTLSGRGAGDTQRYYISE